jgi:hypothetical protein
MELFIGIAAIVIIGAVIYVRNNRAEVERAEAAAFTAAGEPPATVVVPVTESATVVVEGAGAVTIPAKSAKKKAPAKKPSAKKTSTTQATKPKATKAPAKPRAKKPAAIKAPK